MRPFLVLLVLHINGQNLPSDFKVLGDEVSFVDLITETGQEVNWQITQTNPTPEIAVRTSSLKCFKFILSLDINRHRFDKRRKTEGH